MQHCFNKEAKAAVLGLLVLLWITGSADARVIGRSSEISIGREAASAIEKEFRLDTDPAAVARVRQIGRRLVATLEGPDYPFEFHVVEEGEINAFALPGGYVYVFRGLLQLIPNDDALAFVLSHEISHVTRRHGIRQLEKNVVISAGLQAILAGTGASVGFNQAAGLLQEVVGLSFTRRDETDADEHGIGSLARAGYNPQAAAEAMKMVRRVSQGEKQIPALLRSHPAPESRIQKLTALAAELQERRQTERRAAPPPLAAPAVARVRLDGLGALKLQANEWCPLVKGARWTYRTGAGPRDPVVNTRVLEPLDAEPAGVYRVEYDLGRGVRTTRLLACSADRCLSRGESTTGPAPWRLDALLAPGLSAPVGDRMLRCTMQEKIRVPAGEFDALRVELLSPEGKVETTTWYARGAGLVKLDSPAVGIYRELVSYHIPSEP